MKTSTPVKGYFFVSGSPNDSETLRNVIIKTNSQFKILDVIQLGFESEDELSKMRDWLQEVQEYRVVTLQHEDFLRFVQRIERHVKGVNRDLVRILKSRYWNMRSEILYKLKCPNGVSNGQLLTLYGIRPADHNDPYYAEALELLTLANAYTFDKKLTRDLLQKGIDVVRRNQLESKTVEKLLNELMSKSRSIQIDSLEEGKVRVTAWGKTAEMNEEQDCVEGKNLSDALIQILHKKF